MGKVSLKKEITMLESEKGLKDLDHTNSICLIVIDGLKGLSE